MKGIMATLLALGLTGMVSGRQPQNNSNSFNPQQFAQNTAAPTDSQSLAKWEPLTLDLDEPTINELKQAGSLNAKIDPVDNTGVRVSLDTIDGILFTSNASGATTTFQVENKPYELIRPIGRQDRTLVFEFDDYLFGQLKLRNLHYRFSKAELGQFQEVRVNYNGQGITQTPSTLGSDQSMNPARFDSNRGTENFGNPNTGNRNREENFANSRPTDGFREYDPNYMGPTRSPAPSRLDDAIFSRRPPNDSLTRPQWSSNQNPGNVQSFIGSRGNPSSSFTDNRSVGGREAMPERQTFNNPNGNDQSDPRENFGPAMPRDNRPIAPPLDTSLTELQWQLKQTNDRKTEAQRVQLELEQAEADELETANERKRQQLRYQAQRNQDDENTRRTNRDANPNGNQFASQETPIRYADNGTPIYGQSLLENGRSNSTRTASDQTSQPGLAGGWSAAITGPAKEPSTNTLPKNNSTTVYGALFFMLIASLGLNIYLSWLTRSFYVRYSELADELRETFTATM